MFYVSLKKKKKTMEITYEKLLLLLIKKIYKNYLVTLSINDFNLFSLADGTNLRTISQINA